MAESRIEIPILIFLTVCTRPTKCEMRDFSICHDDFSLNLADGVLKERTFPWLGFTQYIHGLLRLYGNLLTTGLQHPSLAPRVVLIHKQFAMGIATDLLQLPKKYKLGNIVFGDYERDEEECGLTHPEIKSGQRCPLAYIEMPIIDITPHPEYIRFGVANSVVLVKLLRPMKSSYMVPICLPTLEERVRKKKHKLVFLIDYLSLVPRDFESERMAKKSLKLFTHDECQRQLVRMYPGSQNISHALCSSGCGVRTGAPIISHTLDGRFELIGLAIGGGPCTTRFMRDSFNRHPPLYIDVFPYNTWAINVITAHSIPRSYPLHFQLLEAKRGERKKTEQKSGWKARTYLSGNLCFRSSKTQKRGSFFYSEKFIVEGEHPNRLNIEIKVSAGIECTIACVRVMLPNRFTTPEIDGVGTYNITVKISTDWFPKTFYFAMGLTGLNTKKDDFIKWLPDRLNG